MAIPAVSLAAWTTALHPLAMTGPITKSERDHDDFPASDSASENHDMLALQIYVNFFTVQSKNLSGPS